MVAATGVLLAIMWVAARIVIMHTDTTKIARRLDNGEMIRLPPPRTEGGMPLAEALRKRRSHRNFSAESLSSGHLAQLCWAAQGINEESQGLRTAPSAGALHPITIFAVDVRGVYKYEPARHALRQSLAGDVRGRLQTAALGQFYVGEAPLCVVITMDVARTASKYGRRAEPYCLL
jgi:nitroreductase